MDKTHVLYQHKPHSHIPRNVNHLHRQEHKEAGFNTRLAVWLTRIVGSMYCAYIFVLIAFVALPAAIQQGSPTVLVNWLSSNFLQLVLLPIIIVGQAVLNRHAELQADEDFHINQASLEHIQQIMEHLDAQDQELLRILKLIESRAA